MSTGPWSLPRASSFPAAYAHGGKLTGIFMVVGFMLSVGIVLSEQA